MILFAAFLNYLSSENPGLLVFCLGIIGILISTFLFNFNRIIYYTTLLCIVIVQSIILINTYLIETAYLQSNVEYIVCVAGVTSYIMIIVLLLKPNILEARLFKLPDKYS